MAGGFCTFRLVVLAFVLGASFAAATSPVEGNVRFDAPLRLVADATVEADAGFLDLAGAARPGSGLFLQWERAEGQLVTNGYAEPNLPGLLRPQVREEPRSETVRFGSGHLSNLTCWAPCQVFLVSEGDARLGLVGGRATGDVRWTVDASHRHAGYPARDDPHAFFYDVGAGWLLADSDADGADALRLPGASPRADGRMKLLLVNATAHVHADGETHALDARASTSSDGLITHRIGRFYLLHLEGAHLSADGPLPARLGAPAWRLQAEGDASSERATGWIEADGGRRHFADKSILLRGDLSWEMHVIEEGLFVQNGGLGATFHGRADLVRVGGDVVARTLVAPAAAVAGVTLLAVVAAAFALLHQGAFSAFYSRLDPPQVAAHPHRQRIQEELRATAGLGPTELARRIGIARVVVQHHLRILHRHGMIVRRAHGPALAYFLPEAAPEPPGVALGVALRNGTTKRLVRALEEVDAPASQTDLAARTGIHPRLVSYHLGKLGRAGLVVVEPGPPQRYVSSTHLRDFLGEQ